MLDLVMFVLLLLYFEIAAVQVFIYLFNNGSFLKWLTSKTSVLKGLVVKILETQAYECL